MTPDHDQTAIEKDFLASWEWIIQFYEDLSSRKSWQELKPMLDLIAALRERGYDKQLRVGQSMST